MRLVDHGHRLGRRICLVGYGGKTGLARAIRARTGLPWIELDALWWLPDWEECTAEQMRERVQEAIRSAPDGWICDGNYTSKIGALALGRADTVIWVNMPWRVVLWRMFWRSVARARDKRPVCGENRESWSRILSPQSLFLWHLQNPNPGAYLRAKLKSLLPEETPVIELATPGELDRFYETQGLERPR